MPYNSWRRLRVQGLLLHTLSRLLGAYGGLGPVLWLRQHQVQGYMSQGLRGRIHVQDLLGRVYRWHQATGGAQNEERRVKGLWSVYPAHVCLQLVLAGSLRELCQVG